MLLSKGLRFNTYQQMQEIRASANQRSVSLLRAPAGADERGKVSPCRERPNPNIYEIIRWLRLSSHTYAAEHPCSVHAPLPTGVLGTARQMCPAQSQHVCLVLLESFNLGTISNTTHTGWECHCAFGEQNHSRGVFWTQRLRFSSAGRNPLKLLQMGRFGFYFMSSTQIFQTARSGSTALRSAHVLKTAHATPDVHDYGRSVAVHYEELSPAALSWACVNPPVLLWVSQLTSSAPAWGHLCEALSSLCEALSSLCVHPSCPSQ